MLDQSIALRPVSEADHEFLVGLFADTRAAEIALLPAEIVPTFAAQQYGLQQLQYRSRFPDAARSIITRVTAAGVTDVGQIIADRPVGKPWTVVDIAVALTARGRGIATAVLQSLCADADAAGVDLTLQVVEDNPARRLYERLGFTAAPNGSLHVPMRRTPKDGVTP